jgi:hypothetical protein
MCEKCRELLRSKLRLNAGSPSAVNGAAVGPVPHTVDKETARMAAYTEQASVTRNPQMFLGAPTADGKSYAVGHTDVVGVKRVMIVPIDAAEEMAKGMLQEIAHVKSKKKRETLKGDLRGVIGKLELGVDLEAIRDELADLSMGSY